MTRINTNVPSLIAQTRLARSNEDLQTALTRLSTGMRINSGADDPAGLIASEALRSEITGLNKAISNTKRASQIISTADSALGQVSSLLNDIRGLVVEAASNGALSADEISANQLQIDSSLEAINRIAQTTTFQGRKLLDGSLDFISDVNTVTGVTDAQIDQANLGTTGSIDVNVEIKTQATQAALTNNSFEDASATSALTLTGSTGEITASTSTITIEGATGTSGVVVQFVQDSGLAADSVGTATYDADANTLVVTGNGTAVTTADIVAAIDGDTHFSASEVDTGTATVDFNAIGATPADQVTLGDNEIGLTLTAATAGSDFNEVTIEYVSGNANAAAYDEDSKTLTVTVNNTAPQTLASLKTVIDAEGTFTAAIDNAGLVDITSGAIADGSTEYTGGGAVSADVVFELTGTRGAESFNFKAGTTIEQIEAAINLVSDSTGVTASVDATTNELTLNSSDYGSKETVSVNLISEGAGGTFGSSLSGIRATGTDIDARVNGVAAKGDGNRLTINTSTLDMSLTVAAGTTGSLDFSITGGGALFQLGSDVVSNQQARLGIASVATSSLRGDSGRLYELGSGQDKSLANDAAGAAKIVDEVINKVTNIRGRLGAFQSTTLESNLVSLNDTVANLQEAESSIRDADFAAESAKLTRAQILVQSGTNVLAMANQNPQSVLSLLR